MASLRQLFDLTGQVALVTGGSRGLGLQICEALGEFGASIVITARKEEELSAAVSYLAERGIEADAIPADLGTEGAANAVVERTMRLRGRLDILVNNAGTTWGAPAEEHPLDQWNKVVDLNLTGAFHLTQVVARTAMIPQRAGCILNVASTAGLLGNNPRMVGTIAYNATKGAVINMTRALAAEWGRYGIRVNALAPGFFPSKMTRATLATHQDQLIENTPLGRLGGPDDLKGAALLLTSAAGGHITGHTLVIDGGASII
jgi:gluconate 5-dehydrogenase